MPFGSLGFWLPNILFLTSFRLSIYSLPFSPYSTLFLTSAWDPCVLLAVDLPFVADASSVLYIVWFAVSVTNSFVNLASNASLISTSGSECILDMNSSVILSIADSLISSDTFLSKELRVLTIFLYDDI